MQSSGRFLKIRLLPLLLLALCWPGIASGKVLVGVIMTANIPYYESMHEAFVTDLRKSLAPEEDIQFILQRPFPDPIAWSNAARKLIAIDVDLIVSYGSPATHAVLFEKSDIPTVYAGVYEPEAINITGPNVTGCGYRVPLSSLLRYFKRIKDIDRLKVVYSSTEEDSVRQMSELVKLAENQKIDFTGLDIRSQADIRKIGKIGQGDGVYLTGSALAHVWIDDILALLQDRKIPAVDIFPDLKEEGILISLSHSPEKQGERAADIALRIIRGEAPGKIPQEMLRETELVLNLVEARKLDINVPIQLIVEATRVIK